MVKRILVTRPAGQADRLCALIEAAGAEAVRLPAIEIHGPADMGRLESLLDELDTFQLAVFVSVNAVEAGMPLILRRRQWPPQLKLAAVGPTSTHALERYGLCVDYVPKHEFSSEGLLAVDALQDMQGKKVVIFRGNGGRSKLYDIFTARGARVVYAEVYSRSCPVINFQTVIEVLQQDNLDIVTAASNETLQNLFVMAGTQGQPLLREKLLVVPGQRQLELAEQLGFVKKPLVAGNASDEAMMAVLKKIISRKGAKTRR
ncbi:MAG: uroporphyrinogen-III synthase [Gammaproteobacteria bacterium]